jgi:hypothetical protein
LPASGQEENGAAACLVTTEVAEFRRLTEIPLESV